MVMNASLSLKPNSPSSSLIVIAIKYLLHYPRCVGVMGRAGEFSGGTAQSEANHHEAEQKRRRVSRVHSTNIRVTRSGKNSVVNQRERKESLKPLRGCSCCR